jgi:hypothetical protein
VLDSRPALALKGWSEDEWERGRKIEMKALNVAASPPERRDWETTTASEKADAPVSDTSTPEIAEAIYSYDSGRAAGARRAQRIPPPPAHLRAEFRHLPVAHGRAGGAGAPARGRPRLSEGDDHSRRERSARNCSTRRRRRIKEAVRLNLNVVFRYYMFDAVAQAVLPAGIEQAEAAEKLPLGELVVAYLRGMTWSAASSSTPDAEDRSDFQRYVDRAMPAAARDERGGHPGRGVDAADRRFPRRRPTAPTTHP